MAFVEEILPELWKIRQLPVNQGPFLNHALTNGGKDPIAIILHHCSGKGRAIIAGTCDHQVAPDQQDVDEFGLPWSGLGRWQSKGCGATWKLEKLPRDGWKRGFIMFHTLVLSSCHQLCLFWNKLWVTVVQDTKSFRQNFCCLQDPQSHSPALSLNPPTRTPEMLVLFCSIGFHSLNYMLSRSSGRQS